MVIAVVGHILHQGVADALDDTAFGLDPGQIGVDGDAVVETKRGHNLGRVLWSGSAAANTIADAQRNITIAALSLSIGLGFTQVPDMFSIFPTLVRTIFAENCVAVVFLGAIIMNPIMPMDSEA